ncbi:hypothetical protein cgR_1376 [Corynebacterium glutamicum R]|uniref:Uncharacterized protein n=1 Tax=Corynebacterium glutamicum (strain R) TaxID=340322 RepID=A0AB72VAF0_CORGB|nr:hypothetical protein cgR_1376 [Corynebacterium glutamicum R]
MDASNDAPKSINSGANIPRIPVKLSDCVTFVLSPAGSSTNEWLPSISPGNATCPSQRSSRAGSATRMVGVKLIDEPPFSFVNATVFPTTASPLKDVMVGCYSGKDSRSLNTSHT